MLNGKEDVGVLPDFLTNLELGNELLIEFFKRVMEPGGILVYQAQIASLKVVGKDLYIRALDASYSIIRALKLYKWS